MTSVRLTLGAPVLRDVERKAAGEETAGGVPGVPVENYQQQRVDEGVNERNMESYLQQSYGSADTHSI